MKNIAVIFAGGYGVRMQKPGMPKQFLEANGKRSLYTPLKFLSVIHKWMLSVLHVLSPGFQIWNN